MSARNAIAWTGVWPAGSATRPVPDGDDRHRSSPAIAEHRRQMAGGLEFLAARLGVGVKVAPERGRARGRSASTLSSIAASHRARVVVIALSLRPGFGEHDAHHARLRVVLPACRSVAKTWMRVPSSWTRNSGIARSPCLARKSSIVNSSLKSRAAHACALVVALLHLRVGGAFSKKRATAEIERTPRFEARHRRRFAPGAGRPRSGRTISAKCRAASEFASSLALTASSRPIPRRSRSCSVRSATGLP